MDHLRAGGDDSAPRELHHRQAGLTPIARARGTVPAPSRTIAEVHAYFAKRRTDTCALLARFVREAKERREIRQDVDVDRTADVILAFMSGVQIQHFLDPAHVDLVAAYERFTAMLLRDLEPRGRQ